MEIKVTSSAFSHEGMIPKKYTCDAEDVSPALKWSGVPEGTQSLALINDDPDAPMGTWVHWVLFNLPPAETGLQEGVPPVQSLPNGAVQGINDFKKHGYGGPCPPSGTHRYYFKLYALDQTLNLDSKAAKSDVEGAMKGHILAQGTLMGKYSRSS